MKSFVACKSFHPSKKFHQNSSTISQNLSTKFLPTTAAIRQWLVKIAHCDSTYHRNLIKFIDNVLSCPADRQRIKRRQKQKLFKAGHNTTLIVNIIEMADYIL